MHLRVWVLGIMHSRLLLDQVLLPGSTTMRLVKMLSVLLLQVLLLQVVLVMTSSLPTAATPAAAAVVAGRDCAWQAPRVGCMCRNSEAVYSPWATTKKMIMTRMVEQVVVVVVAAEVVPVDCLRNQAVIMARTRQVAKAAICWHRHYCRITIIRITVV